MVGKTLAHYEIVEKIGSGGMGEVYRARDTKLDRDIAIKILPAAVAQPVDGGAPLTTLDLRVTDVLTWTPDGSALLYDQELAGVENVWRVPIDGGEPEQLTHFDEEGTEVAAWVMSPDGTALAVSVGRTTEDIVLIENFR